jgi:hypothetical protein
MGTFRTALRFAFYAAAMAGAYQLAMLATL